MVCNFHFLIIFVSHFFSLFLGQWSEDRFREVESRLGPFLRSCGYNPKKDITFVPISALSGQNVRDSVSEEMCPWWKQGSLFNVSS